MRRLLSYKLLAGLGLLLFFYAIPSLMAQNTTVNCEQVMDQMFDAIKQVHTLRYNLFAKERVDGKYASASSSVKLNVSPFKAYYKDNKKGIEVLYVEGQEDNQAIVNPNGFPYFNLHLDPNGKLMHKGQHQTLGRLGFEYIGSILYHSLLQFPDAYQKYVSYRGDTVCDGHDCYNLEIDFPNFHYYSYMVQGNNETVMSIAAKLYLNDYLILSANNISSYEDVLNKGQILSIPNGYAKCTMITIRKDIHLPVFVKVYDNKGLLEEYGFTNVQVNPSIQDAEFTENYADYHF